MSILYMTNKKENVENIKKKKENLNNIKKKTEKLAKNLATTANELNKTRKNLEIAEINTAKNKIQDSISEIKKKIGTLLDEQRDIIFRGLEYHPGRIYGVKEDKNKKIDDERIKVIESEIKKLVNDARALQPTINNLNKNKKTKINSRHSTSVQSSTDHAVNVINKKKKKTSIWSIFGFQ